MENVQRNPKLSLCPSTLAFSLPTFIIPNVNKENLLVESGGAPLSPVAPDQARNPSEDDIMQIRGELLASNSSKTITLHQNSVVSADST